MRTRMQTIFTRRATLTERFTLFASSETPLRKLAGDLSDNLDLDLDLDLDPDADVDADTDESDL